MNAFYRNPQTMGSKIALEQLTSHIERRPTTTDTRVAYEQLHLACDELHQGDILDIQRVLFCLVQIKCVHNYFNLLRILIPFYK